MNKKAQDLVSIVFLLVIVIGGGIGSYNILSENRYIGDISSNLSYDLKYCDDDLVSKENSIQFSSLKDAEAKGFKPFDCSKNG